MVRMEEEEVFKCFGEFGRIAQSWSVDPKESLR